MEISLSTLSWILVCPLIALLIGIVSHQLREAIKTFCEQLSALIEGLYQFAQNGLKKIIGWFKLIETPKPMPSLFGLLILAIGVVASIAEFRINQKTISVIFPWGEEAPMLAFALVALTTATGILAHLANRIVQKAALVLAALLIITQGLLAYQRAAEFLISEGQGDELDIDKGGVIIDGNFGQINNFQASEETTMTYTLLKMLNPTVLLATFSAMLFSTASVVTFWGGTILGGNALTWLGGGLGLAIWGMPSALLFLLHLAVEQDRLTKGTLAVAETVFAICRLPQKVIEWLKPVSFRRRRWNRHQEKMDYNDKMARASAQTIHEKTIADRQRTHELKMQQLQHEYQSSQLETLVDEFSDLHKEICLEILKENLSLMRNISESAVSMVETKFSKESSDLLQPHMAEVIKTLNDYLSLPFKMTKHISQLQDRITADHISGDQNPHQMKGVKDESGNIKNSGTNASTSAD